MKPISKTLPQTTTISLPSLEDMVPFCAKYNHAFTFTEGIGHIFFKEIRPRFARLKRVGSSFSSLERARWRRGFPFRLRRVVKKSRRGLAPDVKK